MNAKGTLRTCEKGHKYYKSSDCPTCPTCEKNKVPKAEFLSQLAAPARRALEQENILTLTKLSEYSVKEILSLHGVGPSTIPKLKKALEKDGHKFKEQ